MVPVVQTLEAAIEATDTMTAPDHQSTSEEDANSALATDSDDSNDAEEVPSYTVMEQPQQPEPTRPRILTNTRDDLLDEADNPHPGPSGVTASGFAAILAASRTGRTTGPPGHATQVEVQPTHTPPDHDNDTEDKPEFSPLKTRGGTVRGPPPSPKRRKPRPN